MAEGSRGGGAVQRKPDDKDKPAGPIGRAETTDFGTYWVVPDGTGPQAGITGEQITQTKFDELKAIWDKIKSGTGQIKISETGNDGTKYSGFKTMILSQFGKLLSKPVGRGVVASLISAGHTVTILPSGPKTIGWWC